MNTRLKGLLVMGVIITLSVMLPACSEAPPDAVVQVAQESDVNSNDGVPRLANGKPDLTGVWDRPAIQNITQSFVNDDGIRQAGESDPLPFTEWGQQQWDNHNPRNDYVGVCLPYGFPRAIVARHPMQLLQHEDYLAFLFEQNAWFTVIPTDGRPILEDAMDIPNWFGHSAGHWEGDTLVIETIGINGLTKLDTVGHPLSTESRLTQRITRTDSGLLEYEMIIDDPKTYTRPLRQQQTWVLRPDWNIMEYSCMENNLENIQNGTINWARPEILE